jgi:DNA-binding transcriptional MerR regulator/DNA gyrase inhibitor GyrI
VFSIGEFSRITGLSVKALRLYHDKGVLVPSRVDEDSGYRYYDAGSVEKARVVVWLRDAKFPLNTIVEILDSCDDEADILVFLERQKEAVEESIREYTDIRVSLGRIIDSEREAQKVMSQSEFEVEEKAVDTMLIAGVRMRGKYCECGKGFGKVCKAMGRHITGKPMCLYYDGEYKEDDADFEPCVPIRKGESTEGISVRELPGGRCVALIHKGPYDELGRSYEKVLAYVKKGYTTTLPSREVYPKGPGMILKGNPKNYLTEIQIMIEG